MRHAAALAVALAALAAGQAALFQPAADFLFLGGQWVDLPKYPGDVGLYKLSFYLAAQHVDVGVELKCRQASAEAARAASAGPGVFEVVLKVRAEALGVSEGCRVVFRSRYTVKAGALGDGVEKVEFHELAVPHYPSPVFRVNGSLYLGVVGRVSLCVYDGYTYNGTVEVSAVGARLYGDARFRGELGNWCGYVAVAPLDFNAALVATVKTRDALGREVAVSRQIPLAVRPRPAPLVVPRVRWLRAGLVESVGFAVRYSIPVNGTVYAGGSSAPLVNGEAEVWGSVYAAPPVVYVPVVVQLDTGAVDRVEVPLPVYSVPADVVEISVSPTTLVAGDVNNVKISIKYPGVFEGSISVSGGVALGVNPVTFTASDKAELTLQIVPTSSVVALDVTVVNPGGYSTRRVVNLLAAQRQIFDVSVEPSEVASGGRHVLRIYVKPLVNVSEATVTLFPVSGLVFPQTTARLGRGGAVDIPVEVPSDVVGTAALGYKIVYTLASGVSGEYGGTLYLVATQRPVLSLSASVSPEKAEPGNPFYLTVRLYNSGGVEARDVRLNVSGPVKVVRQPGPLGAVPPQTSKDAVFTLTADSPGRYQVRVAATYWDRLGRSYTAEQTVEVVVNKTAPAYAAATAAGSGGGGGSNPQLYAVAALAAVAVALLALGFRRGRAGRRS
ncbi:MAG: hypothetical protein ACP5H5_04445 [Pyrobaculum sp.]